MAVSLGTSFLRTSAEPIDNSQVLSKAEMIAMNDDLMPEKYFAVCTDDGKMYVYDKFATPNANTGKFTIASGGGTSDFNDLTNRPKYLGDAMTNKTDVMGFELIEDHGGCYWYDDAYTWMGAWKKTPSGGATGHGMVVSRGQREIGLIKGDAGGSSSQRWRIPMADKVEDMLAEKADKSTTYTKTETDGKIAEAMTDVDNEHFHPVTELPPVAQAKENHEYIVIEYEQDGTTIKSETHYLFYGGAYHKKSTGGISLEGYATEQHVADAFAQHVKTDVPVNAVFTDTVYDDTELAARVTEVEGQHIELTQAQYTALPEEEKMNGKTYFITDGGAYVPAVDIIPHAQQEPIIVGKFDLRGDGEYRNVYRIRKWISDLKNANSIITAGWTETGVYIRPLRVYGSFTFHDYENTSTGWKYIIQQFPIPYSGYAPKEAPSGEKIGLKLYVDHNNKLNMVVEGQSYFNQDDFAQVIIDYIETPIT